jgi:hypothetical protein
MKMTPFHHRIRVAAIAAGILFAVTASAAPPAVTAQLDPTDISLGESAQLTLTVAGSDSSGVAPPSVPGLEFVAVGQSSQFQSVNGVTTSNVSVTYEVIPQHAGTFKFPAMSRGGRPLELHVRSGNAAPSSNSPASSLPPPASSGAMSGTTQISQGAAAFVRLRLPKNELYVGETVPVEIQVGLRPGMVAQIDGLPTLNGDAFTLTRLTAHPEQTQETINGQPYTMLTWHSALSVVKPGDFSLKVETPLTVQVRVAPQRRRQSPGGAFDDPMFDNFFNDSFLQNFFGGTTEKQINVASAPDAIKVLPLPAAGQPADFSGAVGNFNVSSTLSANTAEAGDPLTLRLKVSGTGSFDRVDSKMLGKLNGWRTYQPTAKFEPADSAGYRGEKSFEQAVIPEQPGRQTVPPLAFSFFNPTTRRYETKLTAPLIVAVTPAPGGGAPSLLAGPVQSVAMPQAAQPQRDGLRADHVETGGTVATLLPLYYHPWFVGSQGALVLCFATGLLLLRQRERRANDAEAAQRRVAASAIASGLSAMNAAARRGDAAAFFSSARSALQQQLGMQWRVAPATITIADIDEQLPGDSSGIRQIFALADEAAYSGRQMSTADFEQWTASVREQLKQMETR